MIERRIYYYTCVLILLIRASLTGPLQTPVYTAGMCYLTTCVLILLYMCPHTTIYVSSYYSYAHRGQALFKPLYIQHICVILLHVSSYYYICVLILLYMCPHTTIYVSSYYYICVLILLIRASWTGPLQTPVYTAGMRTHIVR
jgi:hypothetical protein